MNTELLDYAKTLANAGFKVWYTPTNYRDGGFLTYQDPVTGFWGTFQHSDHDGWHHLMPIKPSRENGSSMFIGTPEDPWSVQAAMQCARAHNYNHLVGTQANSGSAWISPKAVRILPDNTTD